MVDETGRTHEKAIETTFLVEALDTVEDTTDNVVTAGCLTAGKDNTYVKRLLYALCSLCCLKLYDRQSVSVGKSFFISS